MGKTMDKMFSGSPTPEDSNNEAGSSSDVRRKSRGSDEINLIEGVLTYGWGKWTTIIDKFNLHHLTPERAKDKLVELSKKKQIIVNGDQVISVADKIAGLYEVEIKRGKYMQTKRLHAKAEASRINTQAKKETANKTINMTTDRDEAKTEFEAKLMKKKSNGWGKSPSNVRQRANVVTELTTIDLTGEGGSVVPDKKANNKVATGVVRTPTKSSPEARSSVNFERTAHVKTKQKDDFRRTSTPKKKESKEIKVTGTRMKKKLDMDFGVQGNEIENDLQTSDGAPANKNQNGYKVSINDLTAKNPLNQRKASTVTSKKQRKTQLDPTPTPSKQARPAKVEFSANTSQFVAGTSKERRDLKRTNQHTGVGCSSTGGTPPKKKTTLVSVDIPRKLQGEKTAPKNIELSPPNLSFVIKNRERVATDLVEEKAAPKPQETPEQLVDNDNEDDDDVIFVSMLKPPHKTVVEVNANMEQQLIKVTKELRKLQRKKARENDEIMKRRNKAAPKRQETPEHLVDNDNEDDVVVFDSTLNPPHKTVKEVNTIMKKQLAKVTKELRDLQRKKARGEKQLKKEKLMKRKSVKKTAPKEWNVQLSLPPVCSKQRVTDELGGEEPLQPLADENSRNGEDFERQPRLKKTKLSTEAVENKEDAILSRFRIKKTQKDLALNIEGCSAETSRNNTEVENRHNKDGGAATISSLRVTKDTAKKTVDLIVDNHETAAIDVDDSDETPAIDVDDSDETPAIDVDDSMMIGDDTPDISSKENQAAIMPPPTITADIFSPKNVWTDELDCMLLFGVRMYADIIKRIVQTFPFPKWVNERNAKDRYTHLEAVHFTKDTDPDKQLRNFVIHHDDPLRKQLERFTLITPRVQQMLVQLKRNKIVGVTAEDEKDFPITTSMIARYERMKADERQRKKEKAKDGRILVDRRRNMKKFSKKMDARIIVGYELMGRRPWDKILRKIPNWPTWVTASALSSRFRILIRLGVIEYVSGNLKQSHDVVIKSPSLINYYDNLKKTTLYKKLLKLYYDRADNGAEDAITNGAEDAVISVPTDAITNGAAREESPSQVQLADVQHDNTIVDEPAGDGGSNDIVMIVDDEEESGVPQSQDSGVPPSQDSGVPPSQDSSVPQSQEAAVSGPSNATALVVGVRKTPRRRGGKRKKDVKKKPWPYADWVKLRNAEIELGQNWEKIQEVYNFEGREPDSLRKKWRYQIEKDRLKKYQSNRLDLDRRYQSSQVITERSHPEIVVGPPIEVDDDDVIEIRDSDDDDVTPTHLPCFIDLTQDED